MTSPFKPGIHRGTIAARSHRVGRATQADGAITTAYRAATTLLCSQCTQPIGPGQFFSRRSRQVRGFGMGQLQVDVCTVCRPLRLEETADAPAALEDKQDER